MNSTSIASKHHPDRNEDTTLGDLARMDAERQAMPKLTQKDLVDKTEQALDFSDQDKKMLAQMAEKERQAAPRLVELGICGALDGMSGEGRAAINAKQHQATTTGYGALASRLASGVMADSLTDLPSQADAEGSRVFLKNALLRANAEILNYRKNRPELKEMITTADLVRVTDDGEGGYDLAFAHAGDSRIYVQNGETGELVCLTTDDGPAAEAMSEGMITEEQYQQVMSADSEDGLPDPLKFLFKHRNVLSNAVGMPGDRFRVASDTFSSVYEKKLKQKGTTFSAKLKKGDRILISSDGVHDNLKDEEIKALMASGASSAEIAAAAKKVSEDTSSGRSKPDDITAVLIEIGREGAPGPKPGAPDFRAASEEFRSLADAAEAEAEEWGKIQAAIDGGGRLNKQMREVLEAIGGPDGLKKTILERKMEAIVNRLTAVDNDLAGILTAVKVPVGGDLEKYRSQAEKDLSEIEDEQKEMRLAGKDGSQEAKNLETEHEETIQRIQAIDQAEDLRKRLEVYNRQRLDLMAERKKWQNGHDQAAIDRARKGL